MTFRQRHRILSRVAAELRRSRGDLIGAAAANTGKLFTEADPEVSESIDFAQYYPFSIKAFSDIDQLRCRGKGVGVVISPWNFPIAIDFIILTGGTATGLSSLKQRPGILLAAETGGKNATIVTAMSDRDQAISNVRRIPGNRIGDPKDNWSG